jgi:hypothetical protein
LPAPRAHVEVNPSAPAFMTYQTMNIQVLTEQNGEFVFRFSIGQHASLLRMHDLDSLIEQLIMLRASTRPARAVEPVKDHNYPLEYDPCWRVDQSPLLEGPVLMLRHAGAGWLAYTFTPASLVQLLEALAAKPPVQLETSQLVN